MSLALWSFIAPHGSLELPAIIIAGGAGFRIGHAMLFPGGYRWKESVAKGGIEATQLVAGVIPMLVVAGCLEGFFSPSQAPVWLKFTVGGLLFTLLLTWLFRPVKHRSRQAVVDADAMNVTGYRLLSQRVGSLLQCSAAGADAGGGVLSRACGQLGTECCREVRAHGVRPVLLCIPYALTARSFGIFRWGWLAVYALLPVAIAFLLEQARSEHDPKQRGNWRDFVVLLVLGLAVDLRWLEPAWPRGLAALGKMLLLDAGILGFLVVRRLDGVGFDLRLTLRDLRRGLGEYLLYAVIAIPLGLWLGFLHVHADWPSPLRAVGALFSRFCLSRFRRSCSFADGCRICWSGGWDGQAALLLTAVIFGLAHWNKRTPCTSTGAMC